MRFAKQFPNVRVNVVELGCTDTDLNGHTGTRRLRKAHTSMSGRCKRRPTDLPELLRRTRPAALVAHRYTKSLRSRLRAEQTSAISQLVLDTATRLYIERGYAGDAVSEKGLPCPASVEVRLSLQALEGSPIDFWDLHPPVAR
jgi:hypothetical protein